MTRLAFAALPSLLLRRISATTAFGPARASRSPQVRDTAANPPSLFRSEGFAEDLPESTTPGIRRDLHRDLVKGNVLFASLSSTLFLGLIGCVAPEALPQAVVAHPAQTLVPLQIARLAPAAPFDATVITPFETVGASTIE